ncbi:Methyl-accepting chemotaxis protein I (serine chemoreceptor protein) [Cronobacter universalis NCTC 9529]|nr:Methyl-accepting chemotaxis protein I (serine chemoreceptor protein) [Cronobacter universalis NCTC 9529]
MGEIVSAVTRVTDIMGEIASASDEQSRGIDQVGLAVAEMDRVTQQNASLVEQSAAAASALEEQASRLTQSVAVFRISQSAQDKPRSVSPVLASAAPVVTQKPVVAQGSDNWETFFRSERFCVISPCRSRGGGFFLWRVFHAPFFFLWRVFHAQAL